MLHELNLLDTPAEPDFDDVTVLSARALNAPVALLSLIDETGDRQFFKSHYGLPEPVASCRQTPLSHSFCKLVTRSSEMLRVIDARTDPRVWDNPAITELGVIAYLGQPVFAPDGTPIGSLCVIEGQARVWTDEEADTLLKLSKMAAARIALRKSLADKEAEHRHLDKLLETLPIGVTTVDDAGRVMFANPAASRMFGVGRDQSDGRTFDDPAWKITTLDGKPFPESELPIARIFGGEEKVQDVVHAIAWPDGQRRFVSVDAARSNRATDRTAVVCAISDVTDRILAKQKLQDALERSEAASRAKSTFVANMSHEVRTPLTGILGLTELLQEQGLPEEASRIVRTIHQSGEALLTVVNSVLDLAQIEAGKLVLHPKPFSVAAILEHQHRLFASLAERKGVRFPPPEIDPTLELMRMGDDFRISQLIGNLLSNAVKFTDEGEVRLGVTQLEGDWLEFSVSDTGVGIAEDHQPRIMKEFEQADSSNARTEYGTGLGLAIVNKLAELMAGKLSVVSTPGSGTEITLRLELPRIAVTKGVQPAQQEVCHAPSGIAGLRVLVAEDNATNMLILKKLLQALEVEAVFARDGREACAAWEEAVFDVLLFDISMPILDGMEALAQIRDSTAAQGLPMPYAIAATANVLKNQENSYIAAGFSDILPKPFRKSDLIDVLGKARSFVSHMTPR